jgi:hypothetical protein
MIGHAAACRRFAVRLVNPFEGVLQVLETARARAYSRDGRVWQVQVLSQRPDHTWRSLGEIQPVEQFFNFGLWDADGGLHKVPANPVMDIGGMQAAADDLTPQLETQTGSLPFPLVDDYEYWSLDDDGRPVALLATTETPATIGDIRVRRWLAARIADHGFVAPSLSARHDPAQGADGSRQHAERLESQVRQASRRQAWFRRSADGCGQVLDPADNGAWLERADFPALGLKTDWADPAAAELVRDWLAWRAPRLLMLQNIDTDTRRWLEQQACRQALELADCHRLYPQVLDPDRVEAARVEARLRRSA